MKYSEYCADTYSDHSNMLFFCRSNLSTMILYQLWHLLLFHSFTESGLMPKKLCLCLSPSMTSKRNLMTGLIRAELTPANHLSSFSWVGAVLLSRVGQRLLATVVSAKLRQIKLVPYTPTASTRI